VNQILGWAGLALFFTAGTLIMVVGVWFFRGLAGHDVRVSGRVAEYQGLVVLLGAIGVLGMGLSLISLSSAPLLPLALGFIALSLGMAAYGVRRFRSRA
jgi:hypothetical protein